MWSKFKLWRRRVRHSQFVKVAIVMALEPDKRHYAYDLTVAAHVRSWPVFHTLQVMMERGWITDGWQTDEEAAAQNRPHRNLRKQKVYHRRFYRVTETGEGRDALQAILDANRDDPRYQHLLR